MFNNSNIFLEKLQFIDEHKLFSVVKNHPILVLFVKLQNNLNCCLTFCLNILGIYVNFIYVKIIFENNTYY